MAAVLHRVGIQAMPARWGRRLEMGQPDREAAVGCRLIAEAVQDNTAMGVGANRE